MKKISVLYIGNDLSKSQKYSTTMETLYMLLTDEQFEVVKSSSKKNKVLRMLDMFFTTLSYRNKVDYILIDTYSTINFYYALLISQLARISKVKYIPILHGGNLPFRLKKSPKFSKLIFKYAYKNIAPSNYLKIEFEKAGYEITFVPNVLNIEDYNFKLRKELEPKILWVRSFKNLYNPTMAITVLNNVLKEYPHAKLCMIGPVHDDSLEKSEELAEKLGITSSVEFIKGMSKKEWHKKAENYDVFINTTDFDNTPISVMEAMALGLLIVSTNVGGLPYLIKDQNDGFLVEKNNAKAMSEIILRAIQSDKNVQVLKLARKKAESFGWNIVKEQWFKILK